MTMMTTTAARRQPTTTYYIFLTIALFMTNNLLQIELAVAQMPNSQSVEVNEDCADCPMRMPYRYGKRAGGLGGNLVYMNDADYNADIDGRSLDNLLASAAAVRRRRLQDGKRVNSPVLKQYKLVKA